MNGRARPAIIGVLLGVSTAASLGLAVAYALGGYPRIEGVLLGLSLGGIGLALVLWARGFLPVGGVVEERHPSEASPAETEAAEDQFAAGVALLGRRDLLRSLLGALTALALAAVFPIRSLAGRRNGLLHETPFAAGGRLVDETRRVLRPEHVPVGGVVTAFPEAAPDAADAATLLIGVGSLERTPGREGWDVAGVVAYSKLCTHAGCPVGLYEASRHQLFCPCHQSVFDVLAGARPVAGPAARPLPQLPLAVDDEGFLVARGDFPEPTGAGFWTLPDDG